MTEEIKHENCNCPNCVMDIIYKLAKGDYLQDDKLNLCWVCGIIPTHIIGEYGCPSKIFCNNIACDNDCHSKTIEDWNNKKSTSIRYVEIEKSELQRLKTLDENIKREISILKLKLEEANTVARLRYFKPSEYDKNLDNAVYEVEDKIRDLESLYKTK